jgi:subtilisin family serine protease
MRRKNNLKLKIKKSSDIVMAEGRKMKLFFYDTSSNIFLSNPVVNIDDRNPTSSLISPADSEMALTVGAVDYSNYENGPIASYSSRGPSWINGSPVIKPEIVAPAGVTTVSYGPTGFSGTSAAAPHVAGVAAIILSLNIELIKNINGFRQAIISYCEQIQSSPDNIYGYGKLVLNTNVIPYNEVGNFVCYPNPVSISKKGYVKITNFPFNTSIIEVTVYTVTGEFVKSFNADDLEEDVSIKKRMIKWDLKNQNGAKIAPGVYFVNIKTILGGKHIKKIAVQK